MKTPMRSILACALMALLPSGALAGPGATQSEFLKIGLSARPAGMGGAFGAVADDLGTMEYNPAGLGLLSNSQVSASYARWLADINFGSVTAAHVMPYLGTIGFSVAVLGMGSIEGNLKDFEAASYLVRAGWGRSLLGSLTAGVGAKVIRESISDLKSSGGTLDAGLVFVPWRSFSLGLSVMNLGKTSAFEEKSDALPLLVKYSLAWKGLGGEMGMVVAAVDVDWYPAPANLFYPAVGVEYWGGRNFALRAGYARRDTDLASDAAGLTLGMGVRWEVLRLDFAYAPFSSLGNTLRFTFNWEIWPLVSLPIPGSSVGEGRSVATRALLPSPPAVLVEGGERSALVKWESPQASDVAGYNVYYRREGDSSWSKANPEPVESETFLVTGLESNVRYHFHVRAVDGSRPPKQSAPSPTATTVPF